MQGSTCLPTTRAKTGQRIAGVALICGAALCAVHVEAQTVYKWVDEDGETHYSQTLPPDRVQQEHAAIDIEGGIEERIDRALTRDERMELERRIQAEQDAEARARLQAQQDRLFLAAYPTEEAVAESVDVQRQIITSELDSVQQLMEQARDRLDQRLNTAAALERDGEPVPNHLVDEISMARSNWGQLNARRNHLRARVDGLEDVLEEELARFRRLTGTDTPAESSGEDSETD